MPTHTDTCVLPYSADFLFDLVFDIELYPAFLPWCKEVRIIEKMPDSLIAKVAIGNDLIAESYRCKVSSEKPNRIDVAYVDGPFKHLNTHWRFIECVDGGCKVDFFIDFEFQSSLFQMLFQKMFSSIVKTIMAAFIERAHTLQKNKAKEKNPTS
jgi:coenzyme Q-binding protein COQ10